MKTAIEGLIATVARLRAPGGCPWDREQTHKSLRDCLIEETAEVLETIDGEDYPHMREELGDLLLQVVMHAQMAAERGDFTFDDVAREVDEKMIRRHPHVFGGSTVSDSEGVLRQWEEIKTAEKAATGDAAAPAKSPFKELPAALPALLRARDTWKTILKKKLRLDADAAGLSAAEVAEKAAGLDEVSAGRQLFLLAAACREAGIDPESALRVQTRKVAAACSDPASAPHA
ncbi:MAG: MazG family protein [Puniceicoccales bacterium]|jgi:XTP/dITP diphosphohydrolase/tetrapyrrole methylase family protein/MazG family protein|nr:MazG family protein [Puniceicoccales bacterium]